MEFNIKFANPDSLAWAFCALAFLVSFLKVSKTKISRKSLSPLFQLILRFFLIFLLCLSILGPYIEKTSLKQRAVALLDISDSMNEGVADELLAHLRNLQKDGLELILLPFAKEVSQVPANIDQSFHEIKSSWQKLDIGKTNLENALVNTTGNNANLLLISDGFETQGSAKNALSSATAGLRIFPLVPLNSNLTNSSFKISRLHAPLIAPANNSVDIRTTIKNATDQPQSGVLIVKHDNKEVLRKEIEIQGGEETVISAESDPSKDGIKEVTAVLEPFDKKFSKSTQTIFISGAQREKVLLISGTDDDAFILKDLLNNQGFQLQTITSPLPNSNFPELSGFSAVLLNNVPINLLPRELPGKLKDYVFTGGAIGMLGGNKSFGLGGYIDSPIEDALPVKCLPPQTLKKRLNVAVALILDKSRSMANGSRLDFAKEGAKEVVKSLKDDDYIGVIGFDDVPFIALPLSIVGQSRSLVAERIDRLFAAGGTSLLPALDEGRRGLMRTQAGRKHIIVLTDGRLPPAGSFYLDQARQMASNDITVSTILVGDDSEDFQLKEMAKIGGGAFYRTQSPADLPRIFLQDVKVSSGERTLKEDAQYNVKAQMANLKSTTIDSFPSLRGYVQTRVKEGANLELVLYADNQVNPALASWKFGRGRSLAFTSDANGRWSEFWVSWPKFGRFWSEVLEWLRGERSNEDAPKFDVRYFIDQGALFIDLSIFSERAASNIGGEIQTPSNDIKKLNFENKATGHLLAKIEQPQAGRYDLRLFAGEKKLTPVAFQISGELFDEQKGQGFNMTNLQQLAALSDGKINPLMSDLRANPTVETRKVDLTPVILIFAILLLGFEIFLREIW